MNTSKLNRININLDIEVAARYLRVAEKLVGEDNLEDARDALLTVVRSAAEAYQTCTKEWNSPDHMEGKGE